MTTDPSLDLRSPSAVDALRASWWCDEPPALRDVIDAANDRQRRINLAGMAPEINTRRRKVAGGYRISTRGNG